MGYSEVTEPIVGRTTHHCSMKINWEFDDGVKQHSTLSVVIFYDEVTETGETDCYKRATVIDIGEGPGNESIFIDDFVDPLFDLHEILDDKVKELFPNKEDQDNMHKEI